jgi:hypothetical protein
MRATEFFDKLSEDDREHLNMLDRAEYLQQTAEFDAAYAQGKCFMCGDVLDHAIFAPMLTLVASSGEIQKK